MTWSRPISEGSLHQQADSDQRSIERYMKDLDLVEGGSIRYFSVGTGEAIIGLPMVKEQNFVYTPQIEELSKDYRFFLYEPRLSRKVHVGVAERAREVLSLMDSLHLRKAHLIAWSDTGSPAYYFAKQWPERCHSVVFLGLADRYKFPQPLQFLVKMLATLPIEYIVPSSLLAHILSKYLGGKQVSPKWVAERAAQIPGLPRLFKHSVLPNLTEHRPQKGEVQVPSVVICGDDDALVTVEQAQRMAKLLPEDTKAVIIPGGEHFLGYVNAELVNEAIRAFYDSLNGNTHSNSNS